MKKIIKSILLLTLIFSITTACTKNDNNKEMTDALKFKEDYESLNGTIREKDGKTIRTITIPDDNPMIYKTAEELVEIVNNKETFIVYFGFNDCPWCRSVIPTLINVAQDLNVNKIYYVDVKDIRDTLIVNEKGEIETSKEGTEGYNKLLELFSNVLDDYTLTDKDGKEIDTKEKRIYAPNIVAVQNGVALKLEEGISEKQSDGYAELTDEIKTEMYDKIKCILECINESNTCSKEKC